MNIEPDIFDYLETTSLEPHDDYTSEITYKDQKIIWNKLKEQDKEIERLKEVLDNIHEEIKYLYRKPKRFWYDDIQTLKIINEIVEKELEGVDKE